MLNELVSLSLCYLRWGIEFVDPKGTDFHNLRGTVLESPGAFNQLPTVHWAEYDQVYSSEREKIGPELGRFHEIATMEDYKRVYSCVHLYQQATHWKALLGMLLMSNPHT